MIRERNHQRFTTLIEVWMRHSSINGASSSDWSGLVQCGWLGPRSFGLVCRNGQHLVVHPVVAVDEHVAVVVG